MPSSFQSRKEKPIDAVSKLKLLCKRLKIHLHRLFQPLKLISFNHQYDYNSRQYALLLFYISIASKYHRKVCVYKMNHQISTYNGLNFCSRPHPFFSKFFFLLSTLCIFFFFYITLMMGTVQFS